MKNSFIVLTISSLLSLSAIALDTSLDPNISKDYTGATLTSPAASNCDTCRVNVYTGSRHALTNPPPKKNTENNPSSDSGTGEH